MKNRTWAWISVSAEDQNSTCTHVSLYRRIENLQPIRMTPNLTSWRWQGKSKRGRGEKEGDRAAHLRLWPCPSLGCILKRLPWGNKRGFFTHYIENVSSKQSFSVWFGRQFCESCWEEWMNECLPLQLKSRHQTCSIIAKRHWVFTNVIWQSSAFITQCEKLIPFNWLWTHSK